MLLPPNLSRHPSASRRAPHSRCRPYISRGKGEGSVYGGPPCTSKLATQFQGAVSDRAISGLLSAGEGPGPRRCAPTAGGPVGPRGGGGPGGGGGQARTDRRTHAYPHRRRPSLVPTFTYTVQPRYREHPVGTSPWDARLLSPRASPAAGLESGRACVLQGGECEDPRWVWHTSAAGDTLLCHIQMSQPFLLLNWPAHLKRPRRHRAALNPLHYGD